MSLPLYRNNQAYSTKPDNAHAGLWFERFFNGYNNDWTIADEAKQTWIKSVTGLQGDKQKLEDFTIRQQTLVTALQGESHCYTTDWHFVTGMGNPHPVENGFSWHPTLAVPYLAGSAVKGLVRAWVESLTDDEKKTRLKHWFGTEDKEQVAEQAGDFIFFDAIPSKPPTLLCDIMTPHMGKWYEQGGEKDNLKPDTIPADWHEPVPVPFLAVKNAQFIFSIAARNPHNKPDNVKELAKIFEALNNALLWLGAGAKTAAGYGYMTEDERFFNDMQIKREDDVAKQAKNAHLNQLSPLEREIEELLETHKSQVPQDYLLNELRKNHWIKAEDKHIVASRVKILMHDANAWFPEPTTSKKNEKKHQRTLEVIGYLMNDAND
ncbi:MAG: type III-B CRISPR module RAMP protein Cmr6 [Methylococcales bacterium]